MDVHAPQATKLTVTNHGWPSKTSDAIKLGWCLGFGMVAGGGMAAAVLVVIARTVAALRA